MSRAGAAGTVNPPEGDTLNTTGHGNAQMVGDRILSTRVEIEEDPHVLRRRIPRPWTRSESQLPTRASTPSASQRTTL